MPPLFASLGFLVVVCVVVFAVQELRFRVARKRLWKEHARKIDEMLARAIREET